MNKEAYEKLIKLINDNPDAIIHYKVSEAMKEYEQERDKDKKERGKKMLNTVKCKDCRFNVLSGCHYLKNNIRIYVQNGVITSFPQGCMGHTLIPDPNFSCSFGQPREKEISSALHTHMEAPPIPDRNVKDLSTLDILLRKAMSISSPEVFGVSQTKNDIAYILQELIRYLMIEKVLA